MGASNARRLAVRGGWTLLICDKILLHHDTRLASVGDRKNIPSQSVEFIDQTEENLVSAYIFLLSKIVSSLFNHLISKKKCFF